jgi:hypothetical protein
LSDGKPIDTFHLKPHNVDNFIPSLFFTGCLRKSYSSLVA